MSDELVNSVVCTSCLTCDEEHDVYEGDVVLTWTGSDAPVNSVVRIFGPDEPVNGVTICWTGVEECVDYEGDVALPPVR